MPSIIEDFIKQLRTLYLDNRKDRSKITHTFISFFNEHEDNSGSFLKADIKKELQQSDINSSDLGILKQVLSLENHRLRLHNINKMMIVEFLYIVSDPIKKNEPKLQKSLEYTRKEYFKSFQDNPRARKTLLPALINKINNFEDVESLNTFFEEHASQKGDFLRQERGFFRIFAEKGQTKSWQKFVNAVQKKAYELVIAKSQPITLLEHQMLMKIFATKTGRIAFFSQSEYQKKYQKLISNNEIKIIDFQPAIKK